LFFIALDNKTGYHQIKVRYCDQKRSLPSLHLMTRSGALASCLSDRTMPLLSTPV
jgi:hypothetical protein